MKVLVADKFETSGLEGLAAAGCEVLFEPDLKDEALVERIAASGAEVLVVRGTKVPAQAMTGGRLALIVRAGAGYNTIDVAAASASGVYVSNCPGKNSVAVAELAMGLILALDRRIPDNVADLRAARWNKKEYSKAQGLFGRRLGVLGLGSIGREVVRRAAAFGMPVVAWSRSLAGQDRDLGLDEARDLELDLALQQAPIRLAPTPVAVAAGCDILTVHVALSPETRGLVSREVLAALPQGAMFINTARAEVVDGAALREAIGQRGLRAGLDVFDGEPAAATADFASPLAALPGVYGTHHIGASTDQAQEAIAGETVRVVRAFLTTGKVPNVVNLARRTPATHRLVVRHRDRPGVLAHIFEHLRAAGLNVQESENIVFEGSQAAIARIHLVGAPSAERLSAIEAGCADILDLRLVAL
jgi:D-3-phosphoglycerate dehydrogenase / 2-oxoglutarate reductase